MANRIWNVEVDGEQHTVEADYSMISGARWVEVDGQRLVEESGGLPNPGNLFEFGSSSYQVTVGDQRGTVMFNLLNGGFDIEMTLALGGKEIA